MNHYHILPLYLFTSSYYNTQTHYMDSFYGLEREGVIGILLVVILVELY